MRPLTSISLFPLTFGAALLASVAATSADACSIRLPGFLEADFPFDGKVVPRNALLRFDTFQFGSLRGVTGPNGPVEGSILHEEGRFAVPELVPGPWEIVVADNERAGAPTRTIAFDVVDEVDTTAPSAPLVTGHRVTRGSHFPTDSCDSSLHDVAVIDVTSGEDDAAFAVMGLQRSAFEDGGSGLEERLSEGGPVAFSVQVEDFAGNVSEATTVTVDGGCEGGGCASSAPTLPGVLLGLGVFALRRRRPQGSTGKGLPESR